MLAVVAAGVVAVAVVATAVAMVAPTPPPPRLVHLSTPPPLRRGSRVTIRGPGSFMPTPCPCRALPTRASWGRVRPPTRLSTRRPNPPRPTPPPSSASWDPALLTALQSVPTAGAYGGGGDWFMDTGASAHMAAHPVILDDYSHFVWTFPLRRKSDVPAILTAFCAFVSTQFGRPIHALQTDNGKEFDNITIRSLRAAHGAVFCLTCPYASPQNGRAERMLRTRNECVRTLLFHAYMPPRFWPDALATVTLLANIRPCRVRWSYTPHHLLYGAPPAYDDLRIFGCRCYPNTAATAAHKLAPRSLPCVFLGYPANTKGYRCYDPVSHRVLTSRHVYFDELVFPFQRGLLATPPTTPPAPAGPLVAGPARRRLTAAAPRAAGPGVPSRRPRRSLVARDARGAPGAPVARSIGCLVARFIGHLVAHLAARRCGSCAHAHPSTCGRAAAVYALPCRPVRLHGVPVRRVCLLGQRQQCPAA
ncbi:hypothetical protein QYE76_066038 [Lolium multiflorum]|uniref:Integrase catalytic domain-containing protein n=1 Tax=Lolium multiflorum TaxID=4521 RepID=A0AAD8SAT1_LOLMU|nr:hypothetical protein QYE76_066038 [Lolium multiflorum]